MEFEDLFGVTRHFKFRREWTKSFCLGVMENVIYECTVAFDIRSTQPFRVSRVVCSGKWWLVIYTSMHIMSLLEWKSQSSSAVTQLWSADCTIFEITGSLCLMPTTETTTLLLSSVIKWDIMWSWWTYNLISTSLVKQITHDC